MRPLSIVSNHPYVDDRPFKTDDEIWVFNKRGTELPRFDVLFQLHTPGIWRDLHGEWLKHNTTVPVYMLEKYPEVPMAIEYPIREVMELTKNVKIGVEELNPFLFNPFSVTLAMALAILQNRPKITLWRIELHRKSEYWKQRNAFSFWTGLAAGRGIELEIRGSEDIFAVDMYMFSIAEYLENKLAGHEPEPDVFTV